MRYFEDEIEPILISTTQGISKVFDRDEHPRPATNLAALAKLPTPFRVEGTVTAGNSSGLNDGACALLVGNRKFGDHFDVAPLGRIIAMTTVGIEPEIMGFAPALATEKLLAHTRLALEEIDVIEINEAFASQVLAVTRYLGLPDDAGHVNPNGGAIALGHPLGMSGARLVTTALRQLRRQSGRYALCAMCIGVGQGIAMVIENPDS